MSSGSSTADRGTLVVWVSHWAASVRVSTNDYQEVATRCPESASGKGLFDVQFELTPGVYSVAVQLGATADSEWVSIRAGKRTEIPVERWTTLQMASAIPLEAASSREAQAGAAATEAEKWSRRTTWSAASGPSRLFVFVKTPDAAKYPDFAQGLSLRDENGAMLTRLSEDAVHVDSAAGWLAFCADLAGGFYVLQRNGPEPFRYNQPLYLSDGWETQVFLDGSKAPSFRSLALHMARLGHGFHRDDETAAAAEAVLTALRRESGLARLVSSAHLKRLLHGEDTNPWLAVLAAYALTMAEDQSHRAYGAAQAAGDSALRLEILAFLRQTLGGHPDVRALLLDLESPAPEPFPFPPLLRIGLQRVRRHATRFTDTIPLDSLTERMQASQVTASPWSVWREPRTAEAEFVQFDDAPTMAPPSARRSRAPAAVVLGTSAPVFRAGPGAGPESRRDDLRQVMYDLPVIKAAKNMIGSTGPVVEKIAVNTRVAAEELLSAIAPETLSAATDIPLGRAERELAELKADVDGPRNRVASGEHAEREVMRYVLRWAARAGAAAEAVSSTLIEQAADSSLEDAITVLRNAAAQLSGATVARDSALTARARQTASKLTTIADALLGRATMVVLTDDTGAFVCANGAFTLLVSAPDDAEFARVCQDWSAWLSTLPTGRSTGLRSPADARQRLWSVRRTEVEDESTHTTTFVNILDDDDGVPLEVDAIGKLASIASAITLQASFFQYGSTEERAIVSLEKLEALVDQLTSLTGVD
jgi:hypothetical protein